MAQLWGGRFEGQTDAEVFAFNASIGFDIRLLDVDIEGSIAHAKMLGKQKIITREETDAIVKGLEEIRAEFLADDSKDAVRKAAGEYEDVHSFVEARLIEKIGDAGKKLHTGRSRNDQVALDMRLYTRKQITHMRSLLYRMLDTLHGRMKEHLRTVMPGFTHLQKAQPVTLAHHLGAYFEMFKRDEERCADIFLRINVCPLGSGALAGTTYPLDRDYVAKLLSFDAVCDNSMDGVSDRDYLIECLSALSLIQMHLSRFAEEIILWNSDEYRFVTIDDAYATGSSIMPQKKNPDVAELVRGKTGRVYGDLLSLLTTMKGLPLAYNKDMQEDKECAFDAFDTVAACLSLFTEMLKALTFHADVMAKSAARGFTNATDAADYLAGKGVPFRDAHEITGRVVLACIEKNRAIDDLTLEELKAFAPQFEEDVFEAVSLKNCVDRRLTHGAPGEEAVKKVIKAHERYLKELQVSVTQEESV
ncbi:MAG: argininosuccinate lyase [Lachnospiraceae bacterium]|nr:argininosuccinate lyase [Lachnospiraceae bacterium]